MRLHDRTLKCQGARIRISEALSKLQEEHELTDIEMLQALSQHQDTMLKYMLRAERHPDNPEKRADED